ncbi:hypothetical protein HD554DRAFT_69645 [Boletus coccyginus]|nr:hypothetical protein HD554DRAFT_69645 [Boletus coccyginus]
MERQDKHRFVRQYVERQKAYVPTYTTDRLPNERHGTPSKPLRSDEFGFDTPVLRSRVPVSKTSQPKLTLQLEAESKPRTNETELPKQGPTTPWEAPSDRPKNKPKSKRKKALTPIETDDERAARLADRRERKRKKHAIVNRPQRYDDDAPTEAQKRGRTNGQKAKKPAALALLYGFSATSVTKGRLTVKPAPSLGVFSKGKASAKKKVSATRKSSSRNEIFSESAFLNKPSERAADHSEIDDDSDNSSISSLSNPPPQATRITKRTKKDRGKCTATTALKTPQVSTHTTAESEVWDIELQSKLPSSVRDVSSEPRANGSAPVVLDLRGAEWSASVEVTEEHGERRKKKGTRSLSATRSRSRGPSLVRSSPLARSDRHVADTPSLHPSHSASQIGYRVANTRLSDLHLVTSKYFTVPEPAPVQEFAATSPQTSRPQDGHDALDFRIPSQDVRDAALDVPTTQRVGSPINSLTSVAQPVVTFQTRYDVVPLEFTSDCSAYDDGYACVDVAWEPLGESDRGYFESGAVDTQGGQYVSAPEYQRFPPSVAIAGDDVECCSMDGFQRPYDQMAVGHEDAEALNSIAEPGDYDPGQGQWFCTSETGEDFPVCEGSICDSEEEYVPEFLEGRALLLGVPEGPRCVALSGVAQAEMDVASRLRDHWRPLRLS